MQELWECENVDVDENVQELNHQSHLSHHGFFQEIRIQETPDCPSLVGSSFAAPRTNRHTVALLSAGNDFRQPKNFIVAASLGYFFMFVTDFLTWWVRSEAHLWHRAGSTPFATGWFVSCAAGFGGATSFF